MILSDSLSRNFSSTQLHQCPHNKSISKKQPQPTLFNSILPEFEIIEYKYEPPRSFEEMKQKIDSQLYKTMNCLTSNNKQKLLVCLNNSNLLNKDSNIFIENAQALKSEKTNCPQEIQKYLSFETGAQLSSEERKSIY